MGKDIDTQSMVPSLPSLGGGGGGGGGGGSNVSSWTKVFYNESRYLLEMVTPNVGLE